MPNEKKHHRLEEKRLQKPTSQEQQIIKLAQEEGLKLKSGGSLHYRLLDEGTPSVNLHLSSFDANGRLLGERRIAPRMGTDYNF